MTILGNRGCQAQVGASTIFRSLRMSPYHADLRKAICRAHREG